jgi:hypothetical protein
VNINHIRRVLRQLMWKSERGKPPSGRLIWQINRYGFPVNLAFEQGIVLWDKLLGKF